MKVLVCDDDDTRSKELADAIARSGQAVNVSLLPAKKIEDELNRLFDVVDRCLAKPAAYKAAESFLFDDFDVAVFDNNLAHFRSTGARLTAEAVVGYVRAFSRVPYIVSVNKNPDVDVDLRFLIGDYTTRADVALNTEHLSSGALWTGKPEDANARIAPWYWPILLEAPNKRRRQVESVKKDLSAAVLPSIGFLTDSGSLAYLSLHAQGALHPNVGAVGDGGGTKPIHEVTFLEVFRAKSRSLPVESERYAMLEAAKDSSAMSDIVARVVAADVDLWMRRDVLAAQEMLVDVPHLLLRMPFLLGGRAKQLAEWNKGVSNRTPPFGIESSLYDKQVASTRYANEDWLRSPAFWWPALKGNDELGKLFSQSNSAAWANVAFCEDVAQFIEHSDGAKSPQEFTAEFEGSWTRRFVAGLSGAKYSPLSRLMV
jgi:hypothetical protein